MDNPAKHKQYTHNFKRTHIRSVQEKLFKTGEKLNSASSVLTLKMPGLTQDC